MAICPHTLENLLGVVPVDVIVPTGAMNSSALASVLTTLPLHTTHVSERSDSKKFRVRVIWI